MSLIGTYFLNSEFIQDTNPEFVKINDVLLGESSKYGYRTVQNYDIGKLLSDQLKDQNVVCILYNWGSGTAYIKKGFDTSVASDSAKRSGFTTFIVKNKIPQFYKNTEVKLWTLSTWYNIGDRISYNGVQYTCINSHRSQSDWLPGVANSLWSRDNTIQAPTPAITPVPVITPAPIPVPSSSITASKRCMPFIDVGAWPPFDMINAATVTGNKYYSLAFIIADASGKPAMAGVYPIYAQPPWYLDKITQLRNLGGDVIISFGGAAGRYLASANADLVVLVQLYQDVINIYKATHISFDIEGSSLRDLSVNDHRNKAIKIIQQNNPSVKVDYVLPVMPDGLTGDGVALLKNAKDNGVILNALGIMTMDYGTVMYMGAAAISACNGTKAQLNIVGYSDSKIYPIFMNGQNDTQSEIFTLANAVELTDYCKVTPFINGISFWSMARDHANNTISTTSSSSHSGIQQTEYAFLNVCKKISTL